MNVLQHWPSAHNLITVQFHSQVKKGVKKVKGYSLTAIFLVVFQPLVWSERSQEVISRHSSRLRCVWLFGLYPATKHYYYYYSKTTWILWHISSISCSPLCGNILLSFLKEIKLLAFFKNYKNLKLLNKTWSTNTTYTKPHLLHKNHLHCKCNKIYYY